MTETTEISTIQEHDAELMNTLCDPAKIEIIKSMFAKNCTNDEFAVFLELSRRYKLDPFSKQIWAVKYNGNAAQIFAGRDGFLSIAHRSGVFDGMESGVDVDKNGEIIGWAKVYRKDMSHPFSITVSLNEYDTGKSLWREKPKTMIQKVAESQCLRRAFSISGLYDPDEFDEDTPDAIQGDSSATTAAENHGTITQDMSVCSRCGKPALSGDRLTRFIETFKTDLNTNLPVPICEGCATKLWKELGGERKRTPASASAPQPQPPAEEPAQPQEPRAPQASRTPQTPKTSSPGRCTCGQPAMTGELREKYVESFSAILNHTLPANICEDCARKLWSDLIQNTKTA